MMMKMNKILSLLAVGFLIVSPALQASWKDIKEKGTLRMATEGAFAPFNYYQGKKLTGFEVELGDLIAKKMGLEKTWSTLPFESLLIGLSQNRFDMVIASHGITEQRAKSVDFASPHYCTGGIILTNGKGPLTSQALKGKKVGVQVGSTYFEQLKALEEGPEIQTFPKDTDALAALMLGRIDAMVTDRFVAREAKEKHQQKNLKLGELIFVERVAMAVEKNSPETLIAVNKALGEVLKNGEYKKLSEKYFGEDVRCP